MSQRDPSRSRYIVSGLVSAGVVLAGVVLLLAMAALLGAVIVYLLL
jgi:hypothetical protein